MKVTRFERTEKTAGRSLTVKIKDDVVDGVITRTIRTSETVTSASGETSIAKTVKVVEYEPGELVSDPETVIEYSESVNDTKTKSVVEPVNEKQGEKLNMIRLSDDAIAKIVSDEFDAAIDAALACDTPVAPTKEEDVDNATDDFDAAIDAALDSVCPVEQEPEEADIRSALLTDTRCQESAPIIHKIEAVPFKVETVRSSVYDDPSVIRAADLFALDCNFRRGYDHSGRAKSLYAEVCRFYRDLGEQKTDDELTLVFKNVMDKTITRISTEVPDGNGANLLLIKYPDFQREVLCDASVSNAPAKQGPVAKKNLRR